MDDVNQTNLLRDRAAYHASAIATNMCRDESPDPMDVARSICETKIDAACGQDAAMDEIERVRNTLNGIALSIESIMMHNRSPRSAGAAHRSA